MLYSNNRDLRRDDSSVRTNVGIVMMVSLEGGGPRSGAGAEALRACREAITQRISRDGYIRVNILSADADENRSGRDTIVGRATARGRSSNVDFAFTCNMDFSDGRVRSVEVNPR
jgi:hypothetical protein